MASRQERRKAERHAAKRAPAQAGAAGAGAAGASGAPGAAGAAAAGAQVHVNPVGDWTTQTDDPNVYISKHALDAVTLKQKADGGDMEALYCLGYHMASEADTIARTPLGTAGRSPKGDAGFVCNTLHRTISGCSLTETR